MSPTLFAADLFATSTGVDWLELLARFQQISAGSAALARRAASRPGLHALARHLAVRSSGYANVGRLLAADLGLSWESFELPTGIAAPAPTETQDYNDVRRLFSRANQAHTLRLDHLADCPGINVSMSLEGVQGGEALGIRIESLLGQSPEDMPAFTIINNSLRAHSVDAGGKLHGMEIQSARGFSRDLPLQIQINASTRVEHVINGEVGAILVQRLESVACPWRVNASLRIGRLVNSSLSGVGIQDFDPDSKAHGACP
jgi:hypothetical protein